MTRKMLVIPLVFAAATLVFPVPPAGATVAAIDDPTGDAKGSKDARADITKVGISYAGGTITLATAVVNAEAPTSKNWIDGDTSVEWTIFHPDGGEYWANFSGFRQRPGRLPVDRAGQGTLQGVGQAVVRRREVLRVVPGLVPEQPRQN